MPVQYPPTLPGPVSYAFTPRERRAVSQGEGTQQLRTRARDVITDAKSVRWMLTCAELLLWDPWYEDQLLHGQRWFVVPLPGYLGRQNRVARFVSPVTRVHRQAGIFELTADLEIRGASALPVIPGGAAPVIGWHAPIGSLGGTAAHPNSGTAGGFDFDFPDTAYAAVVGYTSGPVVWTPVWTPTGSDPSPTFVYPAPGVIGVEWQFIPGGFALKPRGLLLLTATVDGVPTAAGQGIEFGVTALFDSYAVAAWGPE